MLFDDLHTKAHMKCNHFTNSVKSIYFKCNKLQIYLNT